MFFIVNLEMDKVRPTCLEPMRTFNKDTRLIDYKTLQKHSKRMAWYRDPAIRQKKPVIITSY